MKNLDSFYKRATGLLKQYELFTTKQSREMAEMQASGRYSKSYLSAQQEKAGQARQHERQVVAERLDSLKGEFSEALDENYDLESAPISPMLQSIMNSGIQLTTKEWGQLAMNHSGNVTESRLIRDCARRNGFEIDCYTDREAAENSFSEFCRRIGLSLDDDAAGRFYSDSTAAEYDGLSRANALLEHDFSCEPVADTPEAEIRKDLDRQQSEQRAVWDDSKFLEGFSGRPVPEKTAADSLTAQEMQIAAEAAGNGEISEKIAQHAQRAVQDTMFPPKSADGSTTATEATEQP